MSKALAWFRRRASKCDAERAFWQQLKGKRGLRWALYSYPGLVLMFFELMMQVEAHLARPPNAQLSYLRYGKWAFDASLTSRALDPLNTLLPLPKLVAVPLLLSLVGAWKRCPCGCFQAFPAATGTDANRLRQIPERARHQPNITAPGQLPGCELLFLVRGSHPRCDGVAHGGQWIRSLVLTGFSRSCCSS